MEALASVTDLFDRAQDLQADYLSAKPWPHIVIGNGFPEDLMDAIADEVANIDQSHIISCLDVRQIKQEASRGFGPATQHFFDLVDSESFREFISTVTGVDNLLSDPTHRLAGAHRTPPGGFTKIHRDFEVHPVTGLFHRVNLLVYLNRDWPDSYGGSLELWPSDMSAVGRRVFPRFNTMVLWETHGGTLHGLPDPVTCPPNRMRLSVASYYYTKECRPAAAGERRGGRYWAARPEDDRSIEHIGWLDRARSVTPEALKYWIRASARSIGAKKAGLSGSAAIAARAARCHRRTPNYSRTCQLDIHEIALPSPAHAPLRSRTPVQNLGSKP